MIQSLSNPNIKRIVELHSNAGQKAHQQFIAEGQHVIALFLENNFTLQQIYSTSDQLEHAYNLVRTPFDANEQLITVVTEAVLDKMSTAVNPSGLLAVFSLPQKPLVSNLKNSVAFVNLQDPGNMGALIRTAAALNIKTIVRIDGVNCWSPKVVQASAGTLALVNVITLTWKDFVELAKAQNLQLCGMVVKDGKAPSSINFDTCILVIGNEAKGLSEEQQKSCTQLLTIPMPGKTESLNAAVAGSIGLYLAYLQSK